MHVVDRLMFLDSVQVQELTLTRNKTDAHAIVDAIRRSCPDTVDLLLDRQLQGHLTEEFLKLLMFAYLIR